MLITQETKRSCQVWDRASLGDSESWQQQLPAVVADEFQEVCRRHPELAADLDAFVFDPRMLPNLARFAGKVRRTVATGEGFTWIQGLGDLGLGAAEQRLFYVALGLAMGEAMIQYGRTYEIRDRGKDYKDEAIPVSMTGSSTSFHTDSSARDTLPDFVGLLCEQPSLTGGESLVSNALRAHQVLQHEDPAALELLYANYVRDVVTPGVAKTRENLLRNRFPVFAPCARKERIVFRYMRYWIEVGHEKAGEPLSDRHIKAFDLLDEVLGSREQAVSFQLEKGDILWVNNRTLAHNRTEYKDTPGNVRRLQRMWIRLPARPRQHRVSA
jgi:alpha-ketoglutarate-dependent taurine dioxygenase